MENKEELVKAEVKKPTTRTKKTAVTTDVEGKTKKAASAGKTKLKADQKPALDAVDKLEKAVKSKKRIHVEFYGKQVSEDEIAKRLVVALKENCFKGAIKSLEIYFKAEERTAYCVVNEGEPIILAF